MFYIVLILGIFIDLFTKNFVLNNLGSRIYIISDLLFLKYSENTGIAFSVNIPFIKYITIFLIIGIFVYYFYERKKVKNLKLLDLSFGLILAGAIGNGVERIFNSKVIDFIGIKYFAIFNFADVFISIGAFLYLLLLLKNNK